MHHWLQLVRWKNLLIILITQFGAWACVLLPLQYSGDFDELKNKAALLSPANFLLISCSTVFIAAAGYIINDYFDIRIDVINKPNKVILERFIPRKRAIIVHSVLNIAAFLMAVYVAWQGHSFLWPLLQIFCTLMLWRYSTTWKRQFMIGNIVVALMTGLTIVTLMVYEPAIYPFLLQPLRSSQGINPAWVLYFVSFFAFLLTWMREVVKDLEDYKGDSENGCITMPIQWGMQKTIRFTLALGSIGALVLAGCIAYVLVIDMHAWLALSYLLLMLTSIVLWLIFLPKKFTKTHFHTASTYLKLIMVMGIGSMLVYKLFYV